MGIISGYLCLLCFVCLTIKAATRKWKWKKADKFLMRVHKLLSAIFLLLCLWHIFAVWHVLKMRAFMVPVTGVAVVFFMLLLIILCHCIKQGNKKMKWHRILSAAMFVCILCHIVVYTIDFTQYQERIEDISLKEITISGLEDGVYIGEYDAGYIYAKVKVEVENGNIREIILLEHGNERGSAAEQVLDNIVDSRRFPVDTVSGATNSGKVIQKAVENALYHEQAE